MQVMMINEKYKRDLTQKMQLNKKIKAYKSEYSIPNEILQLSFSKQLNVKRRPKNVLNFRISVLIVENVITTN